MNRAFLSGRDVPGKSLTQLGELRDSFAQNLLYLSSFHIYFLFGDMEAMITYLTQPQSLYLLNENYSIVGQLPYTKEKKACEGTGAPPSCRYRL